MLYDIEKRFFLATQYSRLESIALVQRAYRSKYHTKTAPSRSCILNIWSNFRETGSVATRTCYKRKKTVQTEELVEKVKNLVLEDKTISLRKLSQLVPASQSTVRKVVRDVLKLKSYKKKNFQIAQNRPYETSGFCQMGSEQAYQYQKVFYL